MTTRRYDDSDDRTSRVIRRHIYEVPDYRTEADRINAIEQFESFIMLLEMIIQIEPKLFKDAVQAIKRHRDFRFDMGQLNKMKRLFPDMLPDVFYRLYSSYNDMVDHQERKARQKLTKEARDAWKKRLKDQGRLDGEG